MLVVSPAKGLKPAADPVAHARARPGALSYSSVAIGTATHLSASAFQASAGMHAVHISCKGGAKR